MGNKSKCFIGDDGRECASCGTVKPWSEFPKDKSSSTGYTPSCKECRYANSVAWNAANVEYIKQRQKETYTASPEKFRRKGRESMRKVRMALGNDAYNESQKQYRQSKFEEYTTRQRRYRDENRSRLLENNARHRRERPELHRVYDSKKRAKRIKAYVQWADQNAIACIYKLAKVLSSSVGESFHVDHEIPLVNGVVQGLHVEHNLRIVRGPDNLKKSNRYDPNGEGFDVPCVSWMDIRTGGDRLDAAIENLIRQPPSRN